MGLHPTPTHLSRNEVDGPDMQVLRVCASDDHGVTVRATVANSAPTERGPAYFIGIQISFHIFTIDATINMVRRIAFSLLLVTFADASMQMRPALLRQLDTSTSEDSLPSSIMFHQTQQDALHDFFLATEMDSELSRPRHNWRFSEGAGFPTLHYCNFTGVGCDDDLFVSTMELNETMLGGELPSSIGNLTRLVLLRVFNNMIEGSIPQSLAQISGLRNLNIGHNSLSGTLPDFSGSSLQRLILDRNSFTGTVPETLCNLHELSGLDLSGSTKLIGSLPSCLGDLSFLSKLRITDSGLTGSVPTKLCSERVMNVRFHLPTSKTGLIRG
jgi:hypothetical protein